MMQDYAVSPLGDAAWNVVKPDGTLYIVARKRIRFGCVRADDGEICPALRFRGYPCKHIALVESIAGKSTGSGKRSWPMDTAREVALLCVRQLLPFGSRCEIAGSIRRGVKKAVGDIDIVLETADLRAADAVGWTKVSGGDGSATFIFAGVQVNVKAATPDGFGAALLHYTGSKNWNIMCRSRAIGMGWKLNEYGLWNASGGCVASSTEERILECLGLPWREPWEREL
jgi:DNA polymerase (family 10)